MSTVETNVGSVAAVDRAIDIMDAVARDTEPMSLADIARATGFYKSTVLRLIASLEKRALIVRRKDGRYVVGPYAHHLGRAYEASHHTIGVLKPILEDLVSRGTESASFHVYHDKHRRQCLLRVNSRHSTLDHIDVGDLLPLDRGAAGKLITAFRDKDLVPDKSNVLAESIGERDPDCAAVAAAVFGVGGELLGAISLSGPRERFTPSALEQMKTLCLEAAAQATGILSARPPQW